MNPRCLFFPKGPRRLGSSRYRVYAVASRLARCGWEVGIAPPAILKSGPAYWPARYAGFGITCWQIMHLRPQIIYAQRSDRRREQIWLMRLARSLWGTRIVYDVDDPIDLQQPYTRWLLYHADGVVLASRQRFEELGPTGLNVAWMPTPVDLNVYVPPSRAENKGFITIGWIGSGSAYVAGLERMSRVLAALPPSIKARVRFKAVGLTGNVHLHTIFDPQATGVPAELVDEVDWANEEAVVNALLDMDIGLAPSPGTIGGSRFKVVQYMALGIVPLVDLDGETQFIIRNGQNGYLFAPDDLDGYVEAVGKLVQSPSLRSMMSSNACLSAEGYSLDRYVARLSSLLEAIIAGHPWRQQVDDQL